MILLLVDVQNLFYSVRDNFGSEARVDFKKLIEIARNNRNEEVVAEAFIAQYGQLESKDKSVISALRAVGYKVHVKNVKMRRGKYVRTDLDSDMVLTAMDAISVEPGAARFDIVVIASGDSDFVPLYTALQKRGVRTEVLGFQDALSMELQHHVDEIRLLGRSILFDAEEVQRHARSDEERAPTGGS